MHRVPGKRKDTMVSTCFFCVRSWLRRERTFNAFTHAMVYTIPCWRAYSRTGTFSRNWSRSWERLRLRSPYRTKNGCECSMNGCTAMITSKHRLFQTKRLVARAFTASVKMHNCEVSCRFERVIAKRATQSCDVRSRNTCAGGASS